jgi:nucleoside 2-deoxyribosyltransferase
MLIVGGTYHEQCAYPTWDTTQGSGMRAAAALSNTPGVRLLTAVDVDLNDDASLVAGGTGITDRIVIERTDTVGFSYFTPLSVPFVTGPDATLTSPLRGEDDVALVFGMLERGLRDISARRVVLDPQRPRSRAPLDRDGISCEELVLLVNSSEARHFGEDSDVVAAAGVLLDREGAAAVVVKRGAAGCFVATHKGTGDVTVTRVGPYPTARVWPIGSGDTFAAAFTHAWANDADPVQAAHVGSAAAAHWCSTQSSDLPAGLLSGDIAMLKELGLHILDLAQAPKQAQVYLAGPFFTLGEVWLVELARSVLSNQGIALFSPLHDVGRGDHSVAQADIEGLNSSSAVLALLDHCDPGTVFETGYAIKADLPVVGYTFRMDAEGAKMLTGLGGELHNDLSTAVYRAAWRALGAPGLPKGTL